MNKTAFAFSAALSFVALGTSAAFATPVPVTKLGTTTTLPAGVSDFFNVFVNGTQNVVIGVTQADEAACTDPVAIIGGCQFFSGPIVTGGITISPNMSIANQITAIFEPDGITISDIFLIDCNGDRDVATGLCAAGDTGLFSVITPNPATGFVDYNSLLSVASANGLIVGFIGTELVGTATAFPLGNYLTVTGNTNNLPIGANFVSLNDVPEPLTLSLFGAGLVGAVAMRRRKQK